MAGGSIAYRHLGRDSASRMALLRSLVTALIIHEHIQTTHPKAKEAQRMAEKLISLAKRNTEITRRKAQGILYTPHLVLPRLFGEIRERYKDREGGYTRVLLTESDRHDQAKMSILELVDGPRDSRFMITAKAVAYDLHCNRTHTDWTRSAVAQATRFRKDGQAQFEEMVQRFLRRMRARDDANDVAQNTAPLDEEIAMENDLGEQMVAP